MIGLSEVGGMLLVFFSMLALEAMNSRRLSGLRCFKKSFKKADRWSERLFKVLEPGYRFLVKWLIVFFVPALATRECKSRPVEQEIEFPMGINASRSGRYLMNQARIEGEITSRTGNPKLSCSQVRVSLIHAELGVGGLIRRSKAQKLRGSCFISAVEAKHCKRPVRSENH